MVTVTFDKATCIYLGSTVPAIDALDLEIKDGEFLALVGLSGCGKSTSLWMLAGLGEVNSSRILIDDKDVTDVQSKDRDITMMFQNYALYPHTTVRDNAGFTFKIAGTPKDEINRRIEEAAKALDLTQYLDHKPKTLSGGQRQRVTMGRAIVRKPQVFLMGEPLSNLDAKLRVQTRTQVASLQRSLGVTTLYTIHDQTEALTMGDRIAVLKGGVLQQARTPDEMYQVLANKFVVGFIGSPSMNLRKFRVEGEVAKLFGATLTISPTQRSVMVDVDNGEVTIGFHPEDLSIATEGGPGVMPVIVDVTEKLGSDAYAYGHSQGDEAGTSGSVTDDHLVVRVPPHTAPKPGSVLNVRISPGHQHVFSASTGMRLPE